MGISSLSCSMLPTIVLFVLRTQYRRDHPDSSLLINIVISKKNCVSSFQEPRCPSVRLSSSSSWSIQPANRRRVCDTQRGHMDPDSGYSGSTGRLWVIFKIKKPNVLCCIRTGAYRVKKTRLFYEVNVLLQLWVYCVDENESVWLFGRDAAALSRRQISVSQ